MCHAIPLLLLGLTLLPAPLRLDLILVFPNRDGDLVQQVLRGMHQWYDAKLKAKNET